MSDGTRVIENDDDWIRAADVLEYVLDDMDETMTGQAARAVRQRIADSRANANALPEAHYLAACERAGIPTKTKPYWQAGKTGFDDHYIPTWAAPFLEATTARSAQQTRVLRRIAQDEVYRNAGVTVWRLSGLDALARWIDNESKGTDQ